MKTQLFTALLSLAITGAVTSTDSAINMNKIPDEIRARQIQELQFGLFVCWSFSSVSGLEWTKEPHGPEFFNVTGCDTDQWCETAKDAGMKYILFLTKHHDGFCLWDTQTTDLKVTNSPLGVDVLAKLRASCDKYGLKLALYYSEGDWRHPRETPEAKQQAIEYKKAQLKELCTLYGPIEFFWMDHAACGDGGLSHVETVEWIHQFQPNCFIGFNHGQPAGRLCLRERGTPGKLGDPKASKYNKKAEEEYNGFLAAEFTYPLSSTHWFYNPAIKPESYHSPTKIYNDYLGAVKFGNLLSLDVGPDTEGKLTDRDVQILRRTGEMIRSGEAAVENVDPLNTYNVVWKTPSKDHNGSMPLGNGETGLNAWIEKNGDLIFYISRIDSWGDNGRLLKVGRVRITLDPAPSTDDFLQTLNLADGTFKARCGETEFRLWVDANHPVIHAEIKAPQETDAIATTELWRTKPYSLPSLESSDVLLDSSKPNNQHTETIVEPDVILDNQKDQIGWYHRNRKSVGPAMCAKIQGVDGFKRPDPLLHRTFGAIVKANGAKRIDNMRLLSPKSKEHRIDVYVLTKHPATENDWLTTIDTAIRETEKIDFEKRREAHEDWWRAFWNRSWIHVALAEGVQSNDAFLVSQAYALQRYMNACAGRGRYPIKFNGSIFTVPFDGGPGDADYRRWGPGYWWQNTRLPYISMCASGDFDLTEPLYQMYCRDLFEYLKYQTKIHTGHAGIYVPECIYFWGDMFSNTYGWEPCSERIDKLQASGWHKWEWVSGPELVFMMLDRYEHTLDKEFLRTTILPFANEILTFFDLHYKTGTDGKLVMHPSMACETWWDCTNPMPEVAGLHAITDRLLSLPENLTTNEQREFWAAFKTKIPKIPVRDHEGVTMLAPAEKYANKRNVENPELYAVFPFRQIAVGKPNIDLGLQALNYRLDKGNSGWRQDDIFMAYLGLADQAQQNLVDRAKNKHSDSRFPAFWGPNYDWIPDQTHGGVLMKVLQSMILQTDGKKIYLAPAWPKDWNVDFKLHAPYKTTIEGSIKEGELVKLNISPESHRKDVIMTTSE